MDLLEHLRLEFEFHDKRKFLFENYGVVPNIGKFLEKVDSTFQTIVKKCVRGSDVHGTISIEPDTDMFFNELVINYRLANNILEPTKRICTITSMERGILTVNIDINGSIIYLSESIAPVLAHEILHGYEDYCRRCATNGKTYIKDTLTDLYKLSIIIKNHSNMFVKETLRFADCIYWLSPQERRANLCRIENEMTNVPRHISDYTKAMKVVSNTRTYKNYLEIKNTVEILYKNREKYCSIISNNINTKIDGFDITPENVCNEIKMLTIQLKKFERKLETNVPKLAYDIYQKYDITIE